MAVRTETKICPLKIKSLQPPPALFNVVNQFSPANCGYVSGSGGLKILTKNCMAPQFGTYSAGNSAGAAVTSQKRADQLGWAEISMLMHD
jgi:hypothetical protein